MTATITDLLTPVPIPILTAPPSLPGQRDLLAGLPDDEDGQSGRYRRCTQCSDLDQTVPPSIYKATEPCCPRCGNPEFSPVPRRSPEMATKTKPAPAAPAAVPTSSPRPSTLGRGAGGEGKGATKKPTAKTTKNQAPSTKNEPTPQLVRINLDLIDDDPDNARDALFPCDPDIIELADTIRASGLAQPLIVRPSPLDEGRYMLIAGHRRSMACQVAGLLMVDCVVRHVTNEQATELQLLENLQRKDLNPIEEAIAYRRAMDKLQLTQQQLANRVGRTQGHISNHLRLLNLPEALHDRIRDNTLTSTQGRLLAPLADLRPVMKAMTDALDARERIYPTEQPAPLDADEFTDTFSGILDETMRPMTDLGWSGPKFKPDPAQLKALDIRSIGIGGQVEEWAANVILWDQLQEAAKGTLQAMASGGRKPTDSSKANAVETITPEEEAARAAKAAEIYAKRLYRYKIRWLQDQLHKRMKELTDEQLLVLMLGFMVGYHDNNRPDRLAAAALRAAKYKMKSKGWEDGERQIELLTLDRAKLRPILIAYMEDWTDLEARSFSSDANPDLIEALAKELSIDFNREWGIDKEWLQIHTTDQLADLIGEMKIAQPPSPTTTKAGLVDHIYENRYTAQKPGLPKCLAKLKPVRLD